MKQVTLNIPEDRYKFFMELVEQLGLESSENAPIPEWQQELVLKRLKKIEQNPDHLLDWEEVKDNFRLD